MTDNRGQSDASTMNNNDSGTRRDRVDVESLHVTSLAHNSNVIHVGVGAADTKDFNGAIYVRNNHGNRLSIQTFDRYRRRERQRMRQSQSLSEAEIVARRGEHDQEWQERQRRQREANEARWDERNATEGRVLSREEHLMKDEEERKIQEGRKKTRRLTSFFKPVADGLQTRHSNASGVDETVISVPQDNIVDGGAAVDEGRTVEENGAKRESSFKEGMKVFLHVAFIDHVSIDSKLVKDAIKDIRDKGIIGKVVIEEMMGNVAKLNLDEFDKLRDYDLRDAGKDIDRFKFALLKETLHNAEGKVDVKYLTKQNRQRGRNHKGTEQEVDKIQKAVEEAQRRWPKSPFAKAAETLRCRYNGAILGTISADQVRNVYRLKVERRDEPRGPVGRPRMLSQGCIEDLKAFATTAVHQKYSRPVYYFMHNFRKIIRKHGEAESFTKNSANPRKYLRRFIKSARGSRRKVTKQGAKRLSIKQRKKFADTMMLRLAYLVKHYGLTKRDVFNFDETALRYHEDSDEMVIAPVGAKHVERHQSDEIQCPKQCLTFIPMVSCAGDKLDPAMIFKGTVGLTRSIPGYKDGFTKWNELYGDGKICFMQNQGKWTTNETMKEWFRDYIIPRIKKDKQRRRDEGQTVSPKYVIILDGVSTHCLSTKPDIESWITFVQREDKDLILLWLPPNTTGDIQPLDVNFNRCLKVKYRDELYKIRLLAGEEEERLDQESEECDEDEENVVTTEDGIEFHLDVGGVSGNTRSQAKATRHTEAAFKVKSRVIEAIIDSYKSINENQVKTAWRISGRTVMEEFHKGTAFERQYEGCEGYNQAWIKSVQETADAIQTYNGTLFCKGMNGGISDIELGLQFIPTAGMKRKNAPEGTEADEVMEEAPTTSCSVQMSEYASKECPDEEKEDSDDDSSDDDEIVEGLNELALNEQMDQNSFESLN